MNAGSSNSVLECIPPPAYFVVFLLVGWALGQVRPFSLGLSFLPARLGVAIVLFTLSVFTGVWALLIFRREHTTPVPFGTPSALLTSGPFRFSRYPLSIALALALLAFATLLDSVWVLVLVPVLILTLDRFIVPAEESRLRHLFGDQYIAYAARVRRWL